MATWYPVTEEMQNNISTSPLLNVWKVAGLVSGHDLEYSSQIPVYGDYFRFNPNFFHFRQAGYRGIVALNDIYDIQWVSGKIDTSNGYPPHIGFSASPEYPDILFQVGDGDVAGVGNINANIGKIFRAKSISFMTAIDMPFVFRVIGRSAGNYKQDYEQLVCNPDQAFTDTLPSFSGSQIATVFSKDANDYYKYFGALIRVSDTIYYWKSLTEGYLILDCTYTQVTPYRPPEGSIFDSLFELFPELENTETTVQDFIDSIQNFGSNELEQTIEDLLEGFDDFLTGITGLPDLDIDTILGTIGSQFTDAIETIPQTVKPLVDAVSQGIDNALTDIDKRTGFLLSELEIHLKSYFDLLSQQYVEKAEKTDAIVEAQTQVLKDIAELARSNLANPFDWLPKVITLFVDILMLKFGENWQDFLSSILTRFDRGWELTKTDITRFSEGLYNIFEDLANGKIVSLSDFEDRIINTGISRPLVRLSVGLFGSLPVIQMLVSTNLRPIAENLTQLANAKFRPTLNDPSNLVMAYYKGGIDATYLHKELSKHGLSDERIKVLLESAIPLLSPGVLQAAYLRGIISEEKHDNELTHYGYSADDINTIKQLYHQIPPIQDIIRFSVREAFSPEITEKFGQYEDYPQKVEEYASLLGLDPEFTKMYWASHWDLPSPTMGYEMLHRGIIDKEQLKLLLRALDIMPFWRDKLIQLSYRPLTRVDVRRMYQAGTIDRWGVLKAYKDLGYDDNNAELMTQFTITYEAMQNDDGFNERKHLTRSVIELAFSRGVISEADALSRLINLGYVAQDASLLLNVVKYKELANSMPSVKLEYRSKTATAVKDAYLRRLIIFTEAKSRLMALGYSDIEAQQELNYIDLDYSVKIKATVSSYIKKVYTERTITKLEAQNMLSSFGFTGTEQERLFDEMDLLRELRDNKPTYTQFKQMVQKGIITNDEFIEEIRGLGYNDKYVEWLFLLDGV